MQLLDKLSAGFEVAPGLWTPWDLPGIESVAPSAVKAHSGTSSWEMTCVSTANGWANAQSPLKPLNATQGLFDGTAWLSCGTTARNQVLLIDLFDGNKNFLWESGQGSQVTPSNVQWLQASTLQVDLSSFPTAVYMAIRWLVFNPAVGEKFYLDDAVIEQTSPIVVTNYFTPDEAGAEGVGTLWTPDTNASISIPIPALKKRTGNYALDIKSLGAGDKYALTPQKPASANKRYRFVVYSQANVTARNVGTQVRFYAADGTTVLGTLPATPNWQPGSNSGWFFYGSDWQTAPVGTAFVAGRAGVQGAAAANEETLVDDCYLIEESPPFAMTGQPSSASDARRALGSLIVNPGVAARAPFEVEEDMLEVVQRKQGPNLSVDITRGGAYILGQDNPGQGMYYAETDGVINKPLAEADFTFDRIDIVYYGVWDEHEFNPAQWDPDWEEGAFIDVITGTPGGGVPLGSIIPPTYMELARVTVKAKAKAVYNADIQDTRTFIETRGKDIYPQVPTANYAAQLRWQGGFATVKTDVNGHGSFPYTAPFKSPPTGIRVTPTDIGPRRKMRAYPHLGQSSSRGYVTFVDGGRRYQGSVHIFWQALGV